MRSSSANPETASKNRVAEILATDRKEGIRWHVQDARYPLPERSFSAWEDFEYEPGQVSFFATLLNAVEDMLGRKGEFGQNYTEEIIEAGGEPALLAAVSDYEEEDTPGAEVVLWHPREVGRWKLTRKEVLGLAEDVGLGDDLA